MKQSQPSQIDSSEHLSKKVVRGGIWVFSLRIISRGLGFIRTIILARLLVPKDFGLLGIAMLSISILETFSQTGFQTALVQKKENVEPYLDTAWTVSVIRGAFLFLILFFSAPVVAGFFNSPQALPVIRVLSVSILLLALRNPGILFFEKELEFNKQFLLSITTALTNLGVSLTLAFVLRNVWALVWGGLADSFIGLILSYVLHPYRPKVGFEKRKVKELFGFGKWVVGSGILVFLITQGDDILVGKMLGVTALGLYQMAYTLSNLPTTEITHVISQVTFPAYSKLQESISRFRLAYLDVLRVTSLSSILLGGVIFLLAPEFTRIFLLDKWTPIVPVVKILAISAVIRSIGATTGPVFNALGRPNILTKLLFVKLVALSILIYPLTLKYGTIGTAIAVLGSTVLSNPIAGYAVLKVIKCQAREYLRIVVTPSLVMIITIIVFEVVKSHIGISTPVGFVLALLCVMIAFLGLLELSGRIVSYRLSEVFILILDKVRT